MVRKLNVGSGCPKGEYLGSEWTNIDTHADRIKPENGGKVYKVDMLDMPYEDNTFDEVRAIHILEHINRNKTIDAIKECHRVLKPGGVFYVEVPNFRAVITNLYHAFVRENKREIHVWTTSIYGKQRYDGDSHCWGFTEELLTDKLQEASDWARIERKDEMISNHYLMEPVLLIKAIKL